MNLHGTGMDKATKVNTDPKKLTSLYGVNLIRQNL